MRDKRMSLNAKEPLRWKCRSDRKFTKEEIPGLNIPLARLYSNISLKTLERDIEELKELEILIQEDDLYFANISALNKMIAKRKGLQINKAS